ncbi:hypothetical protein ACN28S_12305 [Cystobacter fuscus]
MVFRRGLIAALWLGSLVAAFFIGDLVSKLQADTPERPPSALVKELPPDWESGAEELTRRVQAAFPIGSSEEAMATALRAQGFELQTWNAKPGEEKRADRYQLTPSCRIRASILWRIDDAGKITELKADYHEAGCL